MNTNIKGFVEHIDTTIVDGWAYDDLAETSSLRVEIRQNGVCLAFTHTNIARNDVVAIHSGVAKCGFYIKIEPELYALIMNGSASIWACPMIGSPQQLKTMFKTDRPIGLAGRVLNKWGGIFEWRGTQIRDQTIAPNDVHSLPIESGKSSSKYEGKSIPNVTEVELAKVQESVISKFMFPTVPINRSFSIDGKHFGVVEKATENCLDGWVLSTRSKTAPFVLADGIPATRSEWPLMRRDVIEKMGVQKRAGFHFEYEAVAGSTVDLMAFDGDSVIELSQQVATSSLKQSKRWSIGQLMKDSAKPDAVAITCWEGSHNPIGRAKVLYDILDGRRPVWLFCYLFDEFGGKLWAPLANLDLRIVTIPWGERDAYHRMFQTYGIKFPTVWMCKPRYPTLLLGAAVAAPEARLILDFDDNEEHFSMSKGSIGKIYGRDTLGTVRHSVQKINARTAASNSLAEDYTAEIVRHARRTAVNPYKRRSVDGINPIRIGFVGTVRPHKRILEASQAIRIASKIENLPLEFHVHGDIRPDAYRDSLNGNMALTFGTVLADDLDATLQTFDVVLTGYPAQDDEDEPISRYQITSKIGDALSNGLPVLVPKSRSVEDLSNIPGVFLFTVENFVEVLLRAMRYSKKTKLPEQFTFDGAYLSFKKAEASAPKDASSLRKFIPDQQTKKGKSVLLIWKQPDAGLYGRRVDQIARAIKTAQPDVNVRIVEMMNDSVKAHLAVQAPNFASDASQILELSDRKKSGNAVSSEGVIYDQIAISTDANAAASMSEYLWKQGLSTENTIIIAFPAFNLLNKLAPVISSFPLIVDVVDNQLSWSNSSGYGETAAQYIWLLRGADRVVFNSKMNFEFFKKSNFFQNPKSKKIEVIPNWYLLSADTKGGLTERPSVQDGNVNVIYSGNLNDRIDWSLLTRVAEISDKINLHIVGAASRVGDKIATLTNYPNVIYHGPLDEHRVGELLNEMHFAIMPHTKDHISTFMNPLKVLMYSAHGLRTISTAVPGLNDIDGLVSFERSVDFLAEVESWVQKAQANELAMNKTFDDMPEFAKNYVNLVSQLMSEKLKD